MGWGWRGRRGEALAGGHDEDHGSGFFTGDSVIEDKVGAAGVGPGVGDVAFAVDEIEDGVAGGAAFVAGGEIEEYAFGAAEDFGVVPFGEDGAVGNIACPGGGRGGGDFDDAGGGALAEFDEGVNGIGDGLAVQIKPVEMSAGFEGAGSEGPESIGVFGEGLGLGVGHPIGPEGDYGGFGRQEAEGGGLIGVEFRGDLGEEGHGEEKQSHALGEYIEGRIDLGCRGLLCAGVPGACPVEG